MDNRQLHERGFSIHRTHKPASEVRHIAETVQSRCEARTLTSHEIEKHPNGLAIRNTGRPFCLIK